MPGMWNCERIKDCFIAFGRPQTQTQHVQGGTWYCSVIHFWEDVAYYNGEWIWLYTLHMEIAYFGLLNEQKEFEVLKEKLL